MGTGGNSIVKAWSRLGWMRKSPHSKAKTEAVLLSAKHWQSVVRPPSHIQESCSGLPCSWLSSRMHAAPGGGVLGHRRPSSAARAAAPWPLALHLLCLEADLQPASVGAAG